MRITLIVTLALLTLASSMVSAAPSTPQENATECVGRESAHLGTNYHVPTVSVSPANCAPEVCSLLRSTICRTVSTTGPTQSVLDTISDIVVT